MLTAPISPLLVSNCHRGSEMPGIHILSLSSRYREPSSAREPYEESNELTWWLTSISQPL